ncbi:DNA N-6-adenine-methyltransferase [Nitrosopumilus sp.]|uniref:DNA N-6-adenine-methyltransferase n=1 Tax=Nitrosopumilus sp. TaxID=2024843 RepID=UPI00292EE65E|nr:DNA N-6-adenine-methyltransferase [Nitrosopumilus sp.]
MKSKSKSVQHLHSINIQDEYGTPKELFHNICKKYDICPQIDICASKTNHVLTNYITKEQNCFNYSITQDFFMNPPYSRISEFMEFAYEQHKKNNVSCLILTYSKTGTRWWHQYVQGIANHVDFQKGRISFFNEYGYLTKHSAPYDSAWIIFKKKTA